MPFSLGAERSLNAIVEADIDAAVDACLADRSARSVPLGRSGYRFDLAAAVKTHAPSQAALREAMLGVKDRRLIVRTAILLAVPTEP